MTRIKLQFPEKKVFSTSFSLGVSHINYGGHLGNDSVLTLCHDARIQFLKSIGQTEISIYGAGIIQADAAITYKNEAYLNDEVKVDIYAQQTSPKGFDLYYSLTKDENTIIAQVKTGLVFFDYELKKLAAMPEEFKNLIE